MALIAAINWDVIFQPGNVMFAGVFGVGGLVAILAIGCGSWCAVKKHQGDVRLKRELVSKGYSADEIERIMKIKS